jgi:hypothetical protein
VFFDSIITQTHVDVIVIEEEDTIATPMFDN